MTEADTSAPAPINSTVYTSRDTLNPAIAYLVFNRPEVFNAMNEQLIREFREVAVSLARATDIRVLILKGAGKAFLAGGDVGMFHAKKDDPTLAATVKPMGDYMHDAIVAIRNMPFPVVAQIHGACAGAGVSVALACDFVVVSDKATFNTAYTKIGLSPDGGATWVLPRLLGIRKATELIMLAESIDASVAHQLGIVTKVVPAAELDAEVLSLANRLANGATVAYANAKRLLNESFETPMRRQMDNEIARFADCTKTGDFKEGVTAFVEKRAAKFIGK
ncbi:MAG: enoyl-CoA hydratase/isomerase family protein [Rhodocyclaceae bacterium]|nr:enoyl-CoA hydratase/isomerase family protein [Rhodocyclaceae bacterium]